MRNQDGIVRQAVLPGVIHRHRVGRSRGLESDGEEHNLLVGILFGDPHGIHWRVHNAHIAAGRFDAEQITPEPGTCGQPLYSGLVGLQEPGTRSMSPKEQKITFGLCSDRSALSINSTGVTQTGQPGPCASVISLGEQFVDAVFHDGVRLPAADLHDRPRPGDDARDAGSILLGRGGVAILFHVLHASTRFQTSSSPARPFASDIRRSAAPPSRPAG